MQNMKLVISIIVMLVGMAFLGHLSITFKPFTICLPYLNRAVGALLIGIGILMMSNADRRSGYEDGVNDTRKELERIVLNKIKEKKQ